MTSLSHKSQVSTTGLNSPPQVSRAFSKSQGGVIAVTARPSRISTPRRSGSSARCRGATSAGNPEPGRGAWQWRNPLHFAAPPKVRSPGGGMAVAASTAFCSSAGNPEPGRGHGSGAIRGILQLGKIRSPGGGMAVADPAAFCSSAGNPEPGRGHGSAAVAETAAFRSSAVDPEPGRGHGSGGIGGILQLRRKSGARARAWQWRNPRHFAVPPEIRSLGGGHGSGGIRGILQLRRESRARAKGMAVAESTVFHSSAGNPQPGRGHQQADAARHWNLDGALGALGTPGDPPRGPRGRPRGPRRSPRHLSGRLRGPPRSTRDPGGALSRPSRVNTSKSAG
eukprot:gene15701-biopygen11415